MHYLHAGEGRPTVLLHGLVGSSVNWRDTLRTLSSRASVYAFDQLNVGRSQRVPGLNPSLSLAADHLVGALDVLGLAEADIIGHSHGGALALMVAARAPERVRSLALFAPANPFSSLSDFLVRFYSTGVGRLAAKMGPYAPWPIQRFTLGRMYGHPGRILEGSLEEYISGLRLPGTVDHILAVVRNWFVEMAALESALTNIREIPTLLIWGDLDRAVSLHSAHILANKLAGSELVVVPGAGHIVFEEMPDEANRILIEWLGRGAKMAVLERVRAMRATVQSPPTLRHRSLGS
jgi:pimeloyl-ACP methyl ester carboxylesterase